MDFVTDEHVMAFGAIIHRYAHCESGIKMALSPLLGIGSVDVLIITEPLNSVGLRNVAKSLINSREPLPKASLELLAIVDDLERFGILRNKVAHDRWVKGATPNSIKPARLDIRNGAPRISGIFEEEVDYTVQDLFDSANALGDLSHRIRNWLVEYDPESKRLLDLSDDPFDNNPMASRT